MIPPSSLPSISLIVLNWNGRDHLVDCLESLTRLDYPADRLELILCDNGSTDGSVAYVREAFPGFRLVELEQNLGFAEGNNRAAGEAQGEWVGFLNNDMSVPPDWLRQMIAPLEERPNLACVASRIMNWDGSTIDFIGGGINFQGHGLQLDNGARSSPHDSPRRVLFACGGAMLVRRQLFLDVGGFDPSYFAFFEDLDLGWRLNLLGEDVWYTPAASVLHRHHGTANRLPAPVLKTLSERNALFTIYKNYDDANLAAVLPVALMLLAEKTLLMAGVEVDGFRPEPLGRPLVPPHIPDRAARPGPASRVLTVVREDGLLAAAQKVARKVGGRLAASGGTSRPTEPGAPESHFMHDVALSHVVAISELAHNLETLGEKRSWVQSRRRRSDEEVLALGGVRIEDPTFGHAGYLGFQHWLSRVAGIDSRFQAVEL